MLKMIKAIVLQVVNLVKSYHHKYFLDFFFFTNIFKSTR